jgi:hypothetical protein
VISYKEIIPGGGICHFFVSEPPQSAMLGK